MPPVVLPLSLLIGVALGMLGGGGSILTVPILTIGAGVPPRAAIAGSLFVVAVTSSVALIAHARAGRVAWRVGLWFGIAGMVGAYLGGRLAAGVPAQALMIVFGSMMLATAVAMMRAPASHAPRPRPALPTRLVLVEGVAVGAATGLVGVGGGFLVVPALVLLGRLPMPIAIGTSLVVIAMNSFAGLAGHLGHATIDWPLVGIVTGLAVAGSVLGGAVAGRVPTAWLRRGFGVFVAIMAVVVLGRELWRC